MNHLTGWYQKDRLMHFVEAAGDMSLCRKFSLGWTWIPPEKLLVVERETRKQAMWDCVFPRDKRICLWCAKKILPETRVRGVRKEAQ